MPGKDRLTNLFQNPKHNEAENTTFIKRLGFKESMIPTRVDSINRLRQFYFIYSALEKRLAELTERDGGVLDYFTKAPWLRRSSHLLDDLLEMTAELNDIEHAALDAPDFQYDATQDAISAIEQSTETQLLAYILVRNLADVHGGAYAKAHIQRTFPSAALTLNFYSEEVAAAKRALCTFTKNPDLLPESSDPEFYAAVDAMFDWLKALYDQLEDRRTLTRNYDLDPETTAAARCLQSCNRYALFGGALAVGALAAASASLASNPENPFNP